MKMAKTSGNIEGDFILILEQDGRKMAFGSREIKKIAFDGKKLDIQLVEPKYQIGYMKYLSLLREGVDARVKEAVMSLVRAGKISIV